MKQEMAWRSRALVTYKVDLFWRLVLIEIPITESTRMLRVFAMDYITHTSNLDRVGLLRPSYVL